MKCVKCGTRKSGSQRVECWTNAQKCASCYYGKQWQKAIKKRTDKSFPISNHISPDAKISRTAKVWHGAYVGPNTTIAKNTIIGSLAHIDYNVIIGRDCKIEVQASDMGRESRQPKEWRQKTLIGLCHKCHSSNVEIVDIEDFPVCEKCKK